MLTGFLALAALFAWGSAAWTQKSYAGKSTENTSPIPSVSSQLLLVLADSWETRKTHIYFLEREDDRWEVLRGPEAAVIGKRGFGWGLGLNDSALTNEAPNIVKKEGDGKSPAGVFRLGKVMGYAESLPFQAKVDYERILETHQGVDDPGSRYYNLIVDTARMDEGEKPDWKSHEVMRRKDDLYKWLMVIKHNPDNVPGGGSLIFLHLWRDAESWTAGCTAFSEELFLDIVKWMDSDLNPVIVQLPRDVYDRYGPSWGLPGIEN